MLGVQGFGLVLGKVMKADAVPYRPRAFVGRQDASEHLEQRAFPGAVFANKRHPLASFHREIQRGIDDLLAVAFADAVQIQDMTPAGGDRKSTRLNSSHMSISYAVFCLK